MASSKYADLAKAKVKSGEGLAITVKFLKMETMNQSVIGKLIGVNSVRGAMNGKIYHQYIIETDDGLVKTAFGGAYDAEMLGLIFVGGIYQWIYKGEEKISNGHVMRRYETIQLDVTDADLSAEDCARRSVSAAEV